MYISVKQRKHILTLFADGIDHAKTCPIEYRKQEASDTCGWSRTRWESVLCAETYLCEIQLQLLPVEVCLVQFYSSSCCCFRFAEIYSDSSKAFKQLKCNLVIIDGEKCFKSFLQIEEQ